MVVATSKNYKETEMKMKVVICNDTCLSIEKHEAEGEILLQIYTAKDSNMDGKLDGESIVVKKVDLDKAIDFIITEEIPDPIEPLIDLTEPLIDSE